MLLELEGIKKYFTVKKGLGKSFVRAVDHVSLNVSPLENVSLVGESGCGKTTLARVVLGLYGNDSGTIKFDGADYSTFKARSSHEFRRNVQMVFQDPYNSLDPRFTIYNVLKEAMTLDKRRFKTKKDQLQRMEELLLAVNLKPDMLYRYPHEFSGGERQRIAIARALMLNPKLLILDEAVSSLDVLIQEQIVRLLDELQKKYQLTYLFISHNLKVVRKISQKIAVMYKGKIVELATTEEIFNNPLHPYTKELLAAAVDYKTIESNERIKVRSDAMLIDRGAGHFVIED